MVAVLPASVVPASEYRLSPSLVSKATVHWNGAVPFEISHCAIGFESMVEAKVQLTAREGMMVDVNSYLRVVEPADVTASSSPNAVGEGMTHPLEVWVSD